MSRDASTLPPWIPVHAEMIYSCTGPYSDARMEDAMHALFHTECMKDLFVHLDGRIQDQVAWSFVIRMIVAAVDCVPPGGAATKDRPDLKVRTRAKQSEADKRLKRVARLARELGSELAELEDLCAKVPGCTYSTLALLRESFDSRYSSAEPAFRQFERSLSSYQRHDFPSPAFLLETLADQAEAHPPTSELFSDDPWLRTQQSSWRDFIRIVSDALTETHRMYQTKIELQEKHWVALVQTLISDSISRSSVSDALKEFKA